VARETGAPGCAAIAGAGVVTTGVTGAPNRV